MTLFSGRDCLEVFDLLPLELVSWVVEGLPCYSVLGERLKMERYRGRVTFSCYGKPAKDRLELARYIHIHRFKRDELRAFLEKKHPEMLEYLASKYPPQDPAATPTATTEPGHDQQQVEEIDPKDFAERELAQGKEPGQVMLALVELYDDMPKWKVAGLALRRPIVDLNEFERDKLKSRFYGRTKKFRQ